MQQPRSKPSRDAHQPSRRTCLLGGAGLMLALPAAQATEIGTAPQWPAMRLLDGSTLSPASWVGQPSVLVFWATWCPFCKRHNAHIDKLARAIAPQNLRVLGIALDTDEQLVRRYMSANDYRFPVTLDGAGLRKQLGLRTVIPTTCVFDKQGRFNQVLAGEMFEEDVMDLARLVGTAKS